MAVLAKATQAMDLIARAPGPLRLADAATMLGMPKSSAHRLLNELVEHDLLRRDNDGRFQLGIRLLSWGQSVEQSFDIRGIALPHMQRLSATTGETVNLHVLQGDHRVCLATSRGANVLIPPVPIGQTLPLGIGATGKVLLAFTPDDLQARIRDDLKQSGRAAVTDEELSRIRAAHWATSYHEQEIGLAAGATVITGPGGRVVAALAVGGDVDHFTPERFDELRPQLLQAAQSISHQLTGPAA